MQQSHKHLCRRVIPALFALVLFLPSTISAAGTLSILGQSRWVTVAEVFDGDTFRTTAGEKIRLLGINAPEVMHGTEAGEPLADRSTRLLKSIIDGQSVRLSFDQEKRDRYGRTLAHVYLRDGRWVNQIIITEGMAQLYVFAPNFRQAESLQQSENRARIDMRGMWKNERFRVVDATELTRRYIGQYRVVRGTVRNIQPWRFQLGKLIVTVPRNARAWFPASDNLQNGARIIVHGTIRASVSGQLYLALHSPYDVAPY